MYFSVETCIKIKIVKITRLYQFFQIKFFAKLITLLSIALLSLTAQAVTASGILINVVESGGDVVATASGSINTTGFGSPINVGASSRLIGRFPGNNSDWVRLGGGVSGALSAYTTLSISPPSTQFASIMAINATTSTGDTVGIRNDLLELPSSYVSGAVISGSSTWSNKTLVQLGLTAGTYVWSLPNSQTVTVQIGGSSGGGGSSNTQAIPTLGEWAMIFMASLMAMFGIRRIRRSK